MKLSSIFLFVATFHIAASGYSQDDLIKLPFESGTISEILDEIENQTDYRIFYKTNQLNVNIPVCISNSEVSVASVLSETFHNTELTFLLVDKIIVITPKVLLQQQKITGVITDATSGELVIGASIVIEGTNNGVVSDLEGKFTINVDKKDAVLIISMVGYNQERIVINDQKHLNITLIPDIKKLEEIVVIGYGTQKRSDITGSVGSVSSAKLNTQPSTSPLEVLGGKVAGVSIYNGSGRPGGDFRIKIRGMGSINASNNPLYVIDGVVGGDINLINTNDIETMNILKDASATAIYGAQGSNGVVLITTKKADKQKIKVSYDGNISIGTLARKIDLLDANEFMQMRNALYDDIRTYRPSEASNLVDYTNDYPQFFNADGSPKYNTDWQKESTQTAISKRHYISVTGSSDKFNSGLSFGHNDEEGILLTTFMKKTTARYFGEYKVNKWLKAGTDFSYGYIKQNRLDDYRVGAMTPTRTMIEFPPIFPVKYPDGRYSHCDDIKRKNGAWDIWYNGNPVAVLKRMKLIWEDYQVLGSFYADLQLSPNLKFKSSYGMQYRNRSNKWYINRDWDTYVNKNQADLGETVNHNWQIENLLTYNKVIGNNSLEGMVGASWYNYDTFEWAVSASEFTDDFYSYNNVGLGTDPSRVSSGYTSSRMNSYFARMNYSFKDKYLLTASVRYDGSSRFGKNNRYAVFPSVALGWRVSEESFLKDNNTITYLKLRASYGQSGNNAIGDYLALGSPGSQTVIFNKQKVIGSSQGVMPNNDLKWEKSTELNFGIDLQLIKRINFSSDFYHRLTNDLLYGMPVTQLTGYSNAMTNIGSTLNEGFEFTLETQNINRPSFIWSTTLVFNTNKATVKSLGTNNADLFINAPGWYNTHIMRVGEKIASFWGYSRLGTWGTAEAAEAAKYGLVPGDIKLEDVNKDYKYDIADRKIIGNAFPDFEIGINNSFSYKNWDLSFDIQISKGAEIADVSMVVINDRYNYANSYTKFYREAWTPQNQNTMRPRVRPDLERFDGLDSGIIFDGSFIRGKNIALGYNFSSGILTKLGISNLRLYTSAQNFFLITKYHGYDPEVASYLNTFAQGLELYGYPKARTFNFGVKVTF